MPYVYDDQVDGPRHLWPVEPPPRPVIHAPPPRPFRPYHLATLMLWIGGIFLVCWAGTKTGTFTRREDVRTIRIGVGGVVTRGAPQFPQLDDIPLLLDDAGRATDNGIRRVPPPGVTVHLAPGTPARLIEAGSRGTLVEVSQGMYRGRLGWVPRGYVWPEGLPPVTTGSRAARLIN